MKFSGKQIVKENEEFFWNISFAYILYFEIESSKLIN